MDTDEFTRIEVIARGVCVKAGQILLCLARGSDKTYLPGGHIEFRETARFALEREIREELGVESKAGRFLGCCENSFLQKGEPHAEINLVFELSIPSLSPERPAEAQESWIDFCWKPLDRLAEANLLPPALQTTLPVWLDTESSHFVCGDQWLG